jgi:nicotinamidase-related amidase
MQNLVTEAGPWETPWSARVLPSIVALCERYRDRTIFTRFIPPMKAEDVPGAWRDLYRKWPEVTGQHISKDLLNLMAPLNTFVPPALVIDKMTYSAFSNPQLAAQLQEWRVNSLIISGVETEVCVLATTLTAIDLGFKVIIPIDAVCSSADPGHDAQITIFRSRFSQQIKAVQSSELL